MAESIAKSFVRALQDGSEYIPISVDSIREDTTAGFDIYLKIRPDEPAVLYTHHGVPFTRQARERLQENSVSALFIPSNQEDEYRKYLEGNLREIVTDSTISAADKSEILYTTAQRLVKDLFDDPHTPDGMNRSKGVVSNTLKFIFSEKRALRHLIRSASLDYHVFTHGVNVCAYGVTLARRAGLDNPGVLREFGTALLLQDLGMSKLDATLRESPDKLNVVQFTYLKQHPQFSEELLKEMGGLGEAGLDAVRHHHEKLDGTGYPDGLSGDQLGPLVRIASVVDVFGALTSNRPHRKAYSTYEALQMMSLAMSEELDPTYIRLLIEMMGNPDSAPHPLG